MKRTFYLLCSLIGLALIGASNRGYAQSAIHGTTQIHSGGHLGVYGNLTFVSGAVVTPRNEPTANILWTAGATHSGASNSSHVNGYAEKAGADAFMFPVGDGTKLRMVGISAPTSAGNYRAAYFSTSPASATAPTGGPFPTSNLGTGVSAVSTSEYWDVDGSGVINLSLTWDSGSSVSALTGGDISKLVVVGYNTSTSKWENLGRAGGVTGTMSTTGTVTANTVTPSTYAAFTFGAFGGTPSLPTTGTITIPMASTLVVSITPSGGTSPYSYSICAGTPQHGTATVTSSGQITYIPASGYAGTDAVCLNVCDSSNPQNCNTTTIPINVSGASITPSSSFTIITTGTSSGTIVPPSGGTAPYTYSIVNCQGGASATASAQGGVVSINASTGVYSYTAPAGFTGQDAFCVRVCDSSNPQVCFTASIGVNVTASSLMVSAKAILQGALPRTAGTVTSTTMRDDLRTASLIPTTDPYGKGTTVSSSVLAITGTTAIVDWVLLELRSATNTVTESRAALLRRDGMIVSPADGTSPVSFSSAAGSYYIDVKHRNHLGVMSSVAVNVAASSTTTIDFTNASTPMLGGANSQKTELGVKVMWAGNALPAASGALESVRASGTQSDINGVNPVVTANGTAPLSTVRVLYSVADVDMNGTVRATGTTSDTILINSNVTTHPLNASGALTYVISQAF